MDEEIGDAMVAVIANARGFIQAMDSGEDQQTWLNGLRAALDNLKETIA